MNNFKLFANFQHAQIVAIILLIVFVLLVELVRFLIINKLNIISIVLSFILLIISMFVVKLTTPFIILLIVIASIHLALDLAYLVFSLYVTLVLKIKTSEFIRNIDYDFFVQMNKKGRITDCSSSLLKLSKLAKKDILNSIGWKFIFDNFDVKFLNKEEFTLSSVSLFLNEFKACNSKHKNYKFTLDVELPSKENETAQLVQYVGVVQPVYCKDLLIARNVYFFQDRLQVVEKLKEIVRSACTDLEDAYLQLDLMMSMSEGVVMYYDYHNKQYVATDSMRQYTKTDQREYSFDEIFNHIHPDDVPKYIEQAETVNSLSVTKIRYRLEIGGIYYDVEEDTIALRKDFGLISIIRIAEKEVIQNAPRNAKIRRDVEELNGLFNMNIKDILDKTIDILNTLTEEEK